MEQHQAPCLTPVQGAIWKGHSKMLHLRYQEYWVLGSFSAIRRLPLAQNSVTSMVLPLGEMHTPCTAPS